jgi:hypothetical protein
MAERLVRDLRPLVYTSQRHSVVGLDDVGFDVTFAGLVILILLHEWRAGIPVCGLTVRIDRDRSLIPFLRRVPIVLGDETIAAETAA